MAENSEGCPPPSSSPQARLPGDSGAATPFRAQPPLDFRLLFESSPDVLLVLLPDAPRFTMVAATRARLRATETTLEQTLGRGLFELFPDNPDDPEATGTSNLRASLQRVLATRAPDTMAVQKYDIRGPDGVFQAKFWSPRNLPVLSPAGEVLYILHRVEDVTELVHASELGEALRDRTREMEREILARSRELSRANQELREANRKQGELDAAKTAFFSNISHEFRTPLTLMLGPLEDALADPAASLAPAQRVRLELAQANALRLLKLVNSLLDFSRLEAGRLRPSFAPLDLRACTAELAAMFESAAERLGLGFAIDCPPLSEPAWVDRDLWEKVVPNLISNALKFTPAGGISVRLREAADRFVLEVADTGIGISEEQLPRIFDRFHRVEGALGRTHEGSGIGLSLVRELVGLHGGTVVAASCPGQGSTFRVELLKGFAHLPPETVLRAPASPRLATDGPAFVAEAQGWQELAKPDPAGAGRVAGHSPPASAARILVVDDNADLRRYLASLLDPHYEVVTANDGQAALEALAQRLPDLVVSDVMMPRLDGVGLLRALRAEPATANLPVLLLSARAGEESAIEGLDSGADDYLVKPFSARELLARVRTHLELARTRRAWALQLQDLNRELESFSYSVSHDLRAPLRAIEGFSHALLEDAATELGEEGRGHLARIVGSVRQMQELIGGLLALAQVSHGPLRHERVDLSTLTREVGSRLASESTGGDREVDFVVAEGLTAEGDPRLLRALVENLLGNAWKFTRPCPRARIEVGTLAAPGAVTFFVRDNGVGFDGRRAAHLFAAFRRLHSNAEYEGHGIGLATVQRIVHRHGGRIWAEGARGVGATFLFTLGAEPLRKGPPSGPRNR